MLPPSQILSATEHRPWRLPASPWIMMQGWYDLLFAHWPMQAARLRPLIPGSLAIDTFGGTAWLSLTPFFLRLRPRGLPTLSHFPELNCRTYVKYKDKPGIYFFSLDAGSRLAVFGARTFYFLPYYHSAMKIRKHEGRISYSSRRSQGNASFVGQYHATGPVHKASPGTLEHWLTERYCLYTQHGPRLYRCEIHHFPWSLQEASCEIDENSIASARGIVLPDAPPLCHFAAGLDVLIWPLRSVEAVGQQ